MATGTIVEEVAEEVAQNLEEVAEVTRRIDARGVGIFLGGIGVGIAIGFYFGHRWNKEKIKAEAFKESEEEVAKIREDYRRRAIAGPEKPSVEKVIEERGYSTAVEEQERPLPAPVPIIETPTVVYDGGKSKDDGWNYARELDNRNAEHPYIIHQDEFKEAGLGYEQVTYTYYVEDDVLTDSDDRPLPHADAVVGVENLKFGHGADDIDVVFVRNDKLELDMEICRSPNSYEEEVMGLSKDDEPS